jgi:peptidyl-prolyl cis-trans isomerase B (cyclophilin B)
MTNPTVALDTNHGRIVLELDAEKAPKTVENFLRYVNAGFYDGTLFHRVIPNFMIQGGGFDGQQRQKPTQGSVQNEADNGLANGRGTVAMARTSDPHSATAQFFINLKDNGFLNHSGKTAQGWGYTVFGRVTEGMEVVDKIARIPTSQGRISEAVPQEPVLIEKATALPAAS